MAGFRDGSDGLASKVLAAFGRRALAAPLLASALVLFAAAPAASQDDADYDDAEVVVADGTLNDPFEPLNRVMFGINHTVDILVLRPVAVGYRVFVPPEARRGVSNFLAHAYSPVTFANAILQGNMERAENTWVRFWINTFAGFGGLDDVAARTGWPRYYEDFGQTLAVWGAPSGPYLVVPIIGPATPRHLVGRAVDALANPWTWILWDNNLWESASPTFADGVSTREENIETLDGIRQSSPDYYTTIRSLYHQRRLTEINNGAIVEEDLPDIPDVPR